MTNRPLCTRSRSVARPIESPIASARPKTRRPSTSTCARLATAIVLCWTLTACVSGTASRAVKRAEVDPSLLQEQPATLPELPGLLFATKAQILKGAESWANYYHECRKDNAALIEAVKALQSARARRWWQFWRKEK